MKKRTLGFSVFIVLLAVSLYFTYSNRQLIKDNYVVATTDPSLEASKLQTKLKFTDEGEFLYQASQTELEKAETFRTACSGIERQSIVLGCYSKQRIYIYDVSDKRLDGVRETTAAHEVLHAAYERLSVAERNKVNKMLVKQSKLLTDKHVKETLALYKDLNEDELLNEMHSIFGTELKKLTPELENYYQKYFTKRSLIVAYSDKYQLVFKELQQKNDSLKAQLAIDDKLKKSYETQLTNLMNQIQSDKARLAVLRQSDVRSYNASVGEFNANVSLYNQLLETYKSLISDMNKIITEVNSNVIEQNDLTKKLDSNYNPL